MKILITGGAGMIGFSLANNLLENGFDVKIFDLKGQIDRRKDEIEKISKHKKLQYEVGTIMDKWSVALAAKDCEVVIHLAAMLGVKRTEDNKLLCMDINVNGTENVLNACIHNNVKHFILASSSEVYGEPTLNPVSEKVETKGKTVYAVSKLAAEELTKGFNQIHPQLDFTIVRFFNTYGEGQVAQFVISKFVKRVLADLNPLVYGDGSQIRSFCHVNDAVEAVHQIIKNPISKNKIYNIGNSKEVFSLIETAQEVINTLKPNSNLKVEIIPFDNSDRSIEREINTRFCDNSFAKMELGFYPKISLKEGIKRIAASEIHENW